MVKIIQSLVGSIVDIDANFAKDYRLVSARFLAAFANNSSFPTSRICRWINARLVKLFQSIVCHCVHAIFSRASGVGVEWVSATTSSTTTTTTTTSRHHHQHPGLASSSLIRSFVLVLLLPLVKSGEIILSSNPTKRRARHKFIHDNNAKWTHVLIIIIFTSKIY